MRLHKSSLHLIADRDIERLQALLEAMPAPLEPLDVSALDGYLVGVLLQPGSPIAPSRWLPPVHDVDGRPAPPDVALAPLHALVHRRHAELEQAIAARRWFDPWVFDLAPCEDGAEVTPSEVVLPWIGGFAMALDLFPALQDRADAAALEPLATLYAHFERDDLEDAEELLAIIDTLEPPESVAEAVEDLVRCTLLLADVTRPQRRGGNR